MTTETGTLPLQIDIVSDVVCPWCIIGYKQLEKALGETEHLFSVSLRWQPFELNPRMPAGGQDLREHLAQKYGPAAAQNTGARQRLTELGDSLGFHFDYFEGMRVVNTFQAHQLLHWAAGKGRQTPLKLALFSAFFCERKDVSDPQVLCEVAASVGLPASEAAAVLADAPYAEVVRDAEAVWLEREIHAVPAFIFNDRYSILGAQDGATFHKVLGKLATRA